MPASEVLRDAIAYLPSNNKADYYRKRIGTVLRHHATALGGLA